MRVRIYTSSETGQQPVATVRLSDRREDACDLPESIAPEARFFLVGVEADNEVYARQIREVLQRPSIPIPRSSSLRTRGVRTRGVYTAPEPYGTPAYWRAAFGLMRSETGMIYDFEDYSEMLQAMEA